MNKKIILDYKILQDQALTFDDILLLPNYADFKRSDVDLTTTLHENLSLNLPVISSPMDTVTESAMATAMAKAGGLGIIHRNLRTDKQANMVALVKKERFMVGAAVGAGADLDTRVQALVKAGVDLLTIDSGHGFTKFIIDAVKNIKTRYSKVPVMAGNVATFDGAKALVGAGADILRVGMGPGSICTTRVVTGMGVPQITAIKEAVAATAGTRVTVVADGGVRQVGDMAKALAFGARAVMLGSMLARFDESPGKIITRAGKKWKIYRGMGSVAAMKQGGAQRYGQRRDTSVRKLIPEGVEGYVPYGGSVADFLYQIDGSLRSSFYYLGSKNLNEFFVRSKAVIITGASLVENHPHSIVVQKTGGNYLKL